MASIERENIKFQIKSINGSSTDKDCLNIIATTVENMPLFCETVEKMERITEDFYLRHRFSLIPLKRLEEQIVALIDDYDIVDKNIYPDLVANIMVEIDADFSEIWAEYGDDMISQNYKEIYIPDLLRQRKIENDYSRYLIKILKDLLKYLTACDYATVKYIVASLCFS